MQPRQRYCLFLGFLAITFCSCKKEYSYEGGPASSGYCTNIVGAGNYQVGRDLTDSNFLSVELYVSSAGSYQVSSDTVNGFFFAASGNVADSGITQLHLAAHGKPLSTGNSLFTVRY